MLKYINHISLCENLFPDALYNSLKISSGSEWDIEFCLRLYFLDSRIKMFSLNMVEQSLVMNLLRCSDRSRDFDNIVIEIFNLGGHC